MMPISPVPLADVASHLNLGDRALVAFVGGGGKTTTMFAIGTALGRAVMCTTTKMSADNTGGFETLIGASKEQIVAAVEAQQDEPLLAWHKIEGNKAIGHHPEFCDRLSEAVSHVLVEADGARRKPFTAPGPLEPVIPAAATHVVAVIGADALGRCIGDQCHRPLRIAALAECRPYDRLTPERAARVLLSDRGSRKDVTPDVSFTIAITKVDPEPTAEVIELIERLQPNPVIPILTFTDPTGPNEEK